MLQLNGIYFILRYYPTRLAKIHAMHDLGPGAEHPETDLTQHDRPHSRHILLEE